MPDQLVCMRVGDASYKTPGSVVRNCVTCGCEVHVSPSGVEIMESLGAVPECVPCALPKMKEEAPVALLTPKMRAEIREALDREKS